MGFFSRWTENLYSPENIAKMEDRVRSADRNLERQMSNVDAKYKSMSPEQQRRCSEKYNECRNEYERRREAIDKTYDTLYKAKNR